MKKNKTGESANTGLNPEGNTDPLEKGRLVKSSDFDHETDADDLVHENDFEPTAEFNKEDADDLVHRMPANSVNENDETDPEDRVHENDFEPTAEFNKEDADDQVHRMPANSVNENDETDPDDQDDGA